MINLQSPLGDSLPEERRRPRSGCRSDDQGAPRKGGSKGGNQGGGDAASPLPIVAGRAGGGAPPTEGAPRAGEPRSGRRARWRPGASPAECRRGLARKRVGGHWRGRAKARALPSEPGAVGEFQRHERAVSRPGAAWPRAPPGASPIQCRHAVPLPSASEGGLRAQARRTAASCRPQPEHGDRPG